MNHAFLLAVAAVVVPLSTALAADPLTKKKASAVDYLRTCRAGDVVGFVVPGSDTCLKVGGRLRAETFYSEPFSRSSATTGYRARGYLTLDAANSTDFGLLRATTRIIVNRETGQGATPTLDWAYIQFGNLTAGRIPTSFFEFAPFSGLSFDGGGLLGRGSDYGSINVLAYSMTAGPLTATVALEDGTERRVALGHTTGAFAPTYGGHAAPDLVGRLDLTGTWGQAALTGAVHQSRTGRATDNLFTGGAVGETAYGFAVQGGVKVNLPMVAAGDALFLQAAYATGANSYTGWGGTGVGTLGPATYDVAYDAAGKAKLSDSWSVTGGVLHYWTPTIRQGVFASYGKLDQFGPENDMAAVSAGTNLVWSPVKNLDIGAEVVYAKLTTTPRSILPLAASDHRDGWSGRVRFERDF